MPFLSICICAEAVYYFENVASADQMAATLKACAREEREAFIRFLVTESDKPADFHCRMKWQYVDMCRKVHE